MRIYQADVWCDACGEAIEDRLRAEGKAPEDELDEASYDSDDFPKTGRDDEATDTPQHCAAGGGPPAEGGCLSPTIISGERYGHFFGGPLTGDGIAYVREAFERGGPVAKYWARWYSDDYEVLCSADCCPRLTPHPCAKCGERTSARDCAGAGVCDDCA